MTESQAIFIIFCSIVGALYRMWAARIKNHLYKREKPKSDPPSPRKKQDYLGKLPPVDVPPMPECKPPKRDPISFEALDIDKERQDRYFEEWAKGQILLNGAHYVQLSDTNIVMLSRKVTFYLGGGYHTIGNPQICFLENRFTGKGQTYFFQAVEK